MLDPFLESSQHRVAQGSGSRSGRFELTCEFIIMIEVEKIDE